MFGGHPEGRNGNFRGNVEWYPNYQPRNFQSILVYMIAFVLVRMLGNFYSCQLSYITAVWFYYTTFARSCVWCWLFVLDVCVFPRNEA